MARRGMALERVGFLRYEFSHVMPGEYAVRLELLKKSPRSSHDYIRFVESTGAEYIGSIGNWVYFRKKAEHGAFDLHSNIDSRIRQLHRIMAVVALTFCASALNGGTIIRLNILEPNFDGTLLLGLLCAGLALLTGFGFISLWLKARRLQKDRVIYE